jgi:uncharacterized cupredoxin-like copper-binding protein|tara:strand:- start:8 stop:583 length:576 start_codon:yes stop_codon:yes gene_type:complete
MANGTLKVSNIQTSSGSGTITIGQSGETVTIPSGVTITNSGTATGFGGTNTPLVAVRASTGQTISSGSNTKVQLDTEMIDTDNTFDSSTNYRWSPGVAGKYYMTGTVSLNIASAGKYMQALIYKNGSLASYQQIVAEGTNATYNATADLIDDNDGDDYYELYIRQNTGGDIGLNHSATGLYTRFFGYKLLT